MSWLHWKGCDHSRLLIPHSWCKGWNSYWTDQVFCWSLHTATTIQNTIYRSFAFLGLNFLIPAGFILLILYPRNISQFPLDPFSLSPFIMMEVFLQLSLPSLHSSSPLMQMYLILQLIDWHCTKGWRCGWLGWFIL